MSTPNGEITDFYPGTFDARPAHSFRHLFDEIRRRVTEIVYHGYTPLMKIPKGDVVDLLSGHRVPVKFKLSSGKFRLQFIQLTNVPRIDDRTRLLLLDMATGVETASAIDRLSRMALLWPDVAFKFDRAMAIVINPRATQCLSVGRRDPEAFLNLVDLHTVNTKVHALTSFGDVIVELYTAAQYALVRASFEPVIPSAFPYVVRARFGLRVCIAGITAGDARIFGPMTKRVFDVPNRRFGRLLVPGLYTR